MRCCCIVFDDAERHAQRCIRLRQIRAQRRDKRGQGLQRGDLGCGAAPRAQRTYHLRVWSERTRRDAKHLHQRSERFQAHGLFALVQAVCERCSDVRCVRCIHRAVLVQRAQDAACRASDTPRHVIVVRYVIQLELVVVRVDIIVFVHVHGIWIVGEGREGRLCSGRYARSVRGADTHECLQGGEARLADVVVRAERVPKDG